MVPFRTIVLGQERLKLMLARTGAAVPMLAYGCLLHVRKERARATLGIITLSGEALPLTPRLMAALTDEPILLAGQTRVTLGLLDPGQLAEPDRALDAILLQVLPEPVNAPDGLADEEELDVLAGVEALVSADTLLQPLVLLLRSRPAGWPA
jgi:hypothetical protein